jgi:hypothetical protein
MGYSSPAYTEMGREFRAHPTVEHSKELSGPNGGNNSQVEELNAPAATELRKAFILILNQSICWTTPSKPRSVSTHADCPTAIN